MVCIVTNFDAKTFTKRYIFYKIFVNINFMYGKSLYQSEGFLIFNLLWRFIENNKIIDDLRCTKLSVNNERPV